MTSQPSQSHVTFTVTDDLPPFNDTASRERIWGCHNQRRAFNATRKERTGQAGHGLHANSRDDLPIPDLLAVIDPRHPLPRASGCGRCGDGAVSRRAVLPAHHQRHLFLRSDYEVVFSG